MQLQNNRPIPSRRVLQVTYVNVAVSGCPANFFYLDRWNLCYYVFQMNLQRQAASRYCRALDSRAHLVVINNEQEQEIIADGLSTMASEYTK